MISGQSCNFSILVNSSDGFEDCWAPFFTLFSRYWPSCDVPIFLNTENKIWSYPSLDIRCTCVQKLTGVSRRLTWSECLLGALEQIETPIVLYLHEDYFIERPMQTQFIRTMVDMMVPDRKICHIGLTHFGSDGPFLPWSDSRLWIIPPWAKYRISTQAGLWRVDTLRSYVRPQENAWMFEILGTRRAHRRCELFLTSNRDLYNPDKTPIIQYTHTGIVKGKWHSEMPALFERHGIKVDYSKRGFAKARPWLLRKIETGRQLISNPVAMIRAICGR